MSTTRPPSDEPETAPEKGARRVQSVKGTKRDTSREARIKAALKANIARRKEQARARSAASRHQESQGPQAHGPDTQLQEE